VAPPDVPAQRWQSSSGHSAAAPKAGLKVGVVRAWVSAQPEHSPGPQRARRAGVPPDAPTEAQRAHCSGSAAPEIAARPACKGTAIAPDAAQRIGGSPPACSCSSLFSSQPFAHRSYLSRYRRNEKKRNKKKLKEPRPGGSCRAPAGSAAISMPPDAALAGALRVDAPCRPACSSLPLQPQRTRADRSPHAA